MTTATDTNRSTACKEEASDNPNKSNQPICYNPESLCESGYNSELLHVDTSITTELYGSSSFRFVKPLCNVEVLQKRYMLLEQHIVVDNVLPSIRGFLLSRQIDELDSKRNRAEKVAYLIELIQRRTCGGEHRAFNALLSALAGTQPDLFETITGRLATIEEADFCVKDTQIELQTVIKQTGHLPDSNLDEKVDLKKEFIELAIVENGSTAASEPGYELPHDYFNHLNQPENKTRRISVWDVLGSDTATGYSKKVLIFGRAGIGKSTTLQWLSLQWALGKWSTQFTLLFLIQLRFLTHQNHLISTVELLTLHTLYQPVKLLNLLPIASWLKNSAERVLIQVDGLDEIPRFAERLLNTRKITDISMKAPVIDICVNILRGALLPGATILSASRPFLGLSNLPADTRAEILGLTSEKVKRYVSCRYPDKAGDIISVLHTNPLLLSICGITFYCMYVTHLINENLTSLVLDEEAKTYTRLMSFILVQYTSRRIACPIFPLDTKQYLGKLSKMACYGIFRNEEDEKGLAKLVFNTEDFVKFDIDRNAISAMKESGILQVHERQIGHRSALVAEFFHLAAQEILAAAHLLGNPELFTEQINRLLSGGQFDMALMYVFGLHFDQLEGSPINDLLLALGSSNRNDAGDIRKMLSVHVDDLYERGEHLKVCQLIYEGQWREKSAEMGRLIAPDGVLCISHNTMTAIDLLAVDFVCNNSDRLRSITINMANADETITKVLLASLVIHNWESLNVLNLSANSLGDPGAALLADMLKDNKQLRELILYSNGINEEGGKAIASALERNTGLHHLDIRDNSIADGGTKAMAHMLRKTSTLHSLDISWNNVTDEGARSLANAVSDNSSLRKLNIAYNKIGDAGAIALAFMVRSNVTLGELNVHNFLIGPIGTRALYDACLVNDHVKLNV